MRLGCLGSLAEASKIKDAGFDYIEIHVQDVLKGHQASRQWDKSSPKLKAIGLPIEAASHLLPNDLQVVGNNRCIQKLQDYMQRVSKRAQVLGVKTFIFGSGMARHRDQEVEQGLADLQIQEFVDMAGQICKHHHIDFVVEHLSCQQTNMLNTLEQVKKLCQIINHPNVLAMVDYRQFYDQQEPESSLLEMGSLIRHAHIQPMTNDQEAYDHYLAFFRLLHQIGYDGRITLTSGAKASLWIEHKAAAQKLRQACDQAGR